MGNDRELTDEEEKALLLMAIEDKLRKCLNEQNAEIDVQKQAQKRFILGKQKLDSMMENMNQEIVISMNYDKLIKILFFK